MAKQQKNFRLSDRACEALKATMLKLIAEGHKVTETDVAEMAILQLCLSGPTKSGKYEVTASVTPAIHSEEKRIGKQSKREVAIQERASSDLTAQVVERKDIDYSDVESTPTTHIANLSGGAQDRGRTVNTVKAFNNWRSGRKPLMKPKERR